MNTLKGDKELIIALDSPVEQQPSTYRRKYNKKRTIQRQEEKKAVRKPATRSVTSLQAEIEFLKFQITDKDNIIAQMENEINNLEWESICLKKMKDELNNIIQDSQFNNITPEQFKAISQEVTRQLALKYPQL